MTNKELIELLASFDDDLPVEIYQYDMDVTYELDHATIKEVEHGDYFNRKSYKAIVLRLLQSYL